MEYLRKILFCTDFYERVNENLNVNLPELELDSQEIESLTDQSQDLVENNITSDLSEIVSISSSDSNETVKNSPHNKPCTNLDSIDKKTLLDFVESFPDSYLESCSTLEHNFETVSATDAFNDISKIKNELEAIEMNLNLKDNFIVNNTSQLLECAEIQEETHVAVNDKTYISLNNLCHKLTNNKDLKLTPQDNSNGAQEYQNAIASKNLAVSDEFFDVEQVLPSTKNNKENQNEIDIDVNNSEVISIKSSKSPSPNKSFENIITISPDDDEHPNKILRLETQNNLNLNIQEHHKNICVKPMKLKMDNTFTIPGPDVIQDNEQVIEGLEYNEQENIKDPYDSDSYNGYCSSDFEFITESDAELDVPLITFKRSHMIRQNTNEDENTVKSFRDKIIDSRNQHVVPDEQQFINFFDGPALWPFTLECNFKSVNMYRGTLMSVEHDGVGFAEAPITDDEHDEVARQEADEVTRRIQEQYPEQNSAKGSGEQ